jgi:hypothetical protein
VIGPACRLLVSLALAVAVLAVGAGLGIDRAHAADPCGRAKALERAGLLDEAQEAYVSVLEGAGPARCARRGLDKLQDKQVRRAVRAAEALDAEGFDEAADEVIEEAIRARPDRFEAESVEEKDPWWEWDWLGVLLQIVLAAVVVILLLVLAVYIVREVVRLSRAGLFTRSYLPRRLALAPFVGRAETEVGEQFAAMIGGGLEQLNEETGGHAIARVGAGEGTFEIPPEVTAELPREGKLLAALVQMLARLSPFGWLYYSRTLSGTIQSPGSLGLGVTLELRDRKGAVKDQMTIWEQSFGGRVSPGNPADETERLQALVLPAATWVLYAMRAEEEPVPLGTENWRSYAFFAQGTARRNSGYKTGESDAYWKALRLDPLNRGALFALASYDLEDARRDDPPNADAIKYARARLHLVWTLIEEDDKRTRADKRRDPLWYRTSYALAAEALYDLDAMDGRSAKAREAKKEEAHRYADAIVVAVEGVLPSLRPDRAPQMVELLETMKRSVAILLAGVDDLEELPDWLDPWDRLDYRSRYNVACYLARTSAGFTDSLEELGYALRAGPPLLREWARFDPSLEKLRKGRPDEFTDLLDQIQRSG